MSQSVHSAETIPARLKERQGQFEQAWEAALAGGPPPDWREYLPGPGEPVGGEFARLLIQTDIEYRVKAGLAALLEQPYFDPVDEGATKFGSDDCLELIRWEYQKRWNFGQRILRKEYIERFPEYAAALADLRPRWNCDKCQLKGIQLDDEHTAAATCPRCQAAKQVTKLFPAAKARWERASSKPTPPGSDDTPLSAGSGQTSEAVPGPGARYRPLRFHARGNLGEVHVAEDTELGRTVALKRIQDRYQSEAGFAELQDRFMREAEITGRLEHPGIVPVYGLVKDGQGQPCYAMRFVEGQTLADAIRNFYGQTEPEGRDSGTSRLAFRELLGQFVAVCKAMGYAHSRGIIHRDLKPANILLGKYGETLVVDWGLAKKVERGQTERTTGEASLVPILVGGHATETPAGQLVGTPAYMSPEQALGGHLPLSSASDIYSLGAVLYEILSGRPPFTGSLPVVLAEGNRSRVRRLFWPFAAACIGWSYHGGASDAAPVCGV